MSDWLENSHKANMEIIEEVHELKGIANACDVLGNVNLADKLYMITSSIAKNNKIMNQCIEQQTHEGFEASQKASANLLSIALKLTSKNS